MTISKKFFKVTGILIILSIICSFFSFGFKTQNASGRYSGYGDGIMLAASYETENVYYTNKEETFYETTWRVPFYSQIGELSNSCGPTAGAIVVGFYDRYYDNLIPDYVPYYSTGAYKRNDKVAIPNLMTELYTLMRTNVDDVGVGQADCLDGLKAYVNGKGNSISYTNIKSNNTVNESALTSAVNSNHPSLLFCSKMDLYSMSQSENYDTVVNVQYIGGHVAVAYGVYIVKYYNGSSNFRTDRYIAIATGLPGNTSGFLKIESTDWCNAAYEVTIS